MSLGAGHILTAAAKEMGEKIVPRVLGGRSSWGETDIRLCSAVQDWYLCPLQSAGHCGAGIVLMLCGQAWPDDGVGRTPLRSQRCTRSVPHA